MIIIADQILLYRKIHVLLLLFFCDVIFKFCIEHPEKIFWSRHWLALIVHPFHSRVGIQADLTFLPAYRFSFWRWSFLIYQVLTTPPLIWAKCMGRRWKAKKKRWIKERVKHEGGAISRMEGLALKELLEERGKEVHAVSLKVLIPINWLINPRIFM